MLLAPITIPAIDAPAAAATAVVAFQTPKGIVTADVDGKNPVLRVQGAFEPRVSPDGRRLVFARIDSATRQAFWYSAAITGAGVARIGTGLPALGMPSWSPDGLHLVMSDGVQLYVVTVATGTAVAIPGSVGERSPQWSPDGSLIAAQAANGVDQVLQRPDGTSRVVRPDTPTGPWSPDGRHMLIVAPARNGLEAVDVVTGDVQNLGFLRESFGYLGAAWAPSAPGTLSAYLSVDSWLPYDPGTTTVYRYDAIEGDTLGTTSEPITIASPATFPSAGGYTVTDVNGAPAAVTLGSTTVTPSYVHLAWTAPVSTPDYAGVEVRYALGDTPPASIDGGLDGGRLLTGGTTLGPFAPDQHISVSVFSRDWSGHVGAAATTTAVVPHAAAVTLTAHAVPFDSVAGTRSVITVAATRDFDHSPVSGAVVTVSRRAWPTTNPFVPLATLHADEHGVATMTQIPSQTYSYLFTYAGDADHTPRTALTRIRVARRVSLRADHTSGAAGTLAHLSVTTTPPLVKGTTYLQKFTTRFVDLGPHDTNSLGATTFAVKFPARGTSVRYRVRVPGRDGYIDSVTAIVTLTGT